MPPTQPSYDPDRTTLYEDELQQNRLEMDHEIQQAIQMASRYPDTVEEPTVPPPSPREIGTKHNEPEEVCTLGGSCATVPSTPSKQQYWVVGELIRLKDKLYNHRTKAAIHETLVLFFTVLVVHLPQVQSQVSQLFQYPVLNNHPWLKAPVIALGFVLFFTALKTTLRV